MTEDEKQIRFWIEEEYELLKGEDREEPLCDHEGAFLLLRETLVDRLVEKHEISDAEQYDDVRRIIRYWWLETASAEQLHEYATYNRQIASRADTPDEQRSQMIKNAEALEQLAVTRAIGLPNPNN